MSISKVCSVEDCENKHQALGYCDMHYKRLKRNGLPQTKYEMHSKSYTTEYNAWKNMRKRCYDPKASGYKNYGGRGITVCESWQKSFIAFLEDMGNKPDGSYSLDRINGSGNYEPGNVRWASRTTQNINRRPSLTGDSGIQGVRYVSRLRKWHARLCINGTEHNLGLFTERDDAIKARKSAELKYFTPVA